MNSFTLEGITYNCQYRTCNKPTCACQTDPNKAHGPYWYRRVNGRVQYIGRNLPENIARARDAHDRRLAEMSNLKRQLDAQIHALYLHMTNQYLTPDNRAIICGLGFGDTLTATDEEVFGPED